MKVKKGLISERFFSIAPVDVEGEEKRTYQASLSSEYSVARYGYTEILVHDESAIDFSRANSGLVLLFNHDRDQPIGRVNNVSLRDDGKLAGDIVFSETAEGQRMQSLVDEGTLTDISISYSIEETREEENHTTGGVDVFVTRWTPLETSVVSVPADHTVGMGRDLPVNQPAPEGIKMNIEQRAANLGLARKQGETDEQLKARCDSIENNQPAAVVDFSAARNAGQGEGQRQEFERQQAIRNLFDKPRYKGEIYVGLREQLISGLSTVEQARSKLLELVGSEVDGENYTPPTPPQSEQRAAPVGGDNMRIQQVGTDGQLASMRAAAEEKFGILDEADKPLIAKNDYRGWSLSEMARESLHIMGVNTRGMSVRDAVGFALNPGAMPYDMQRSFVGAGTSVFTALVENIVGKSMMSGFEESGEVWRQLVRIGTVSSFRQESRVDLSAFPDLDHIAENGEYKRGNMSDAKEYIQAEKYGKTFGITREMIINDDLSAMTGVPIAMGRSADRKIGDLVMAILTSNPTLAQDSKALFHADHANNITSGAAPSVSQLDAMYKLLALQTDIGGNGSGQNVQLAKLIVPVALEMTARVLASATNDPDQKATDSGGGGLRPNPFAGRFEVVSDPRLDAASSTVFYGMADPNRVPTIEVAFINGNQAPSLESQNGFTVDGIEYKVRQEVGVSALSYRGIVKNAGA